MMKKYGCTYLENIPADAIEIPLFKDRYVTPRGEIITKIGLIKLRKQGVNGSGYFICGMRRDDGRMCFPLVHRLVAQAFVSGDQSLTVNHIDMDKQNNNASNLEWVTFSENHRKGRLLKPEWGAKTGRAVSRAIVAIHTETQDRHEFPSGKAAALWIGNVNAAGNISKAVSAGLIAYGFRWERTSR